MKNIQVLHVITGGLQREGISSTQLEFFKHMDLNRYKIYVAAVHNDCDEMIAEYGRAGCVVISFPDRKKHTVKYFWELVKWLKIVKPNIIHVHGSSSIMSIELLAAKIAGIKIRIAHSRNTKADQAKIDKMFRTLFNMLYTFGVACGKEAGEWLFGNKEFEIIHNGKDFNRFRFDSEQRKEQRKNCKLEKRIVVGHVGCFNYQKNHNYVVRVFEQFCKSHDNAILYLIGDGPLFEECKMQVSEAGLSGKVIFAGSVNDVPNRLQSMDIMIFPSRFEGLPNVVLEWQAEGLPCLISDKITTECAVSDLVQFASIEDDPKVWSDKMDELLDKYTNRETQGARGTEALKQNGFDINDAAKKLEDIYEELILKS